LINWLINSFKRKKARRIFTEYPYTLLNFQLPEDGEVMFARWDNPLTHYGEINQAQVDFYRKFIKKGDLAIDIGANIGDTTVPMALAAGKEGMVLGFDPNPFVFKILKKNAELNPDKTNIVPLPYAISESPGEFIFSSAHAAFGNGGISSITGKSHGKYQLKHKIQGVNLMKFLNQNYESQLPRLSFIKIDTEGLDMMIVKSIQDLIKAHQPVVIAECFAKLTDEEKLEFYKLFQDLNYVMHYFEDFNIHAETYQLDEQKMQSLHNFNFYAIPN